MKSWTRDELILAINLYCKTPFGRIHIRNPEIIELAKLLNRTPGSVSYKLANFASIDPSLDRKGVSNVCSVSHILRFYAGGGFCEGVQSAVSFIISQPQKVSGGTMDKRRRYPARSGTG